MADVFLSYASRDRKRVRAVHDALREEGFGVFWDQEIPAGADWDACIRRHLAEARCAIVVWSRNSVASDSVRHEAALAKKARKLVPAQIDGLAPEDFPMGFYAMQNACLESWRGDRRDSEWLKLVTAVHKKLDTASPDRSPSKATGAQAQPATPPKTALTRPKRKGEDQLPLDVDQFALQPSPPRRRRRKR